MAKRSRARRTLAEIPARSGIAARVATGQTLTVVNTTGSQVVDFWAFRTRNGNEFMSMEHTRPTIHRLVPQVGDALYTNMRRAVFTVTEDTTAGVHDTTVAACCPNRYRQLGVKGYHESCQENLYTALRTLRRVPPEVPCPFNLFQNSQYDRRGDLQFKPPACEPGQHIALRAEMDCVIVLSACPMDVFPLNGAGPSAAHYHVG